MSGSVLLVAVDGRHDISAKCKGIVNGKYHFDPGEICMGI